MEKDDTSSKKNRTHSRDERQSQYPGSGSSGCSSLAPHANEWGQHFWGQRVSTEGVVYFYNPGSHSVYRQQSNAAARRVEYQLATEDGDVRLPTRHLPGAQENVRTRGCSRSWRGESTWMVSSARSDSFIVNIGRRERREWADSRSDSDGKRPERGRSLGVSVCVHSAVAFSHLSGGRSRQI